MTIIKNRNIIILKIEIVNKKEKRKGKNGTDKKPVTKKAKTTGRKRKYNGLETKVMRLPSQFEGLFNALSDKLSDKKHTKKEIEEITKSLVSSIK